jgi:hypothetical protein
VLEGRSLHPRTRKSQEGALSVEARIILLLNIHTIATMMMMTRRARRRIRKKNKNKKDKMTVKKKKGGSYVVTCNSDASSSDDDDSDETRPLRRRVMQALPYKRSLFSLTLHHASWLRSLKYKLVMIDVMRNMIMKVKVKVKVTMMMNPLKIN